MKRTAIIEFVLGSERDTAMMNSCSDHSKLLLGIFKKKTIVTELVSNKL